MSSTTPAPPATQRIFTSDNTAGASPEIVRAVADAARGQDLPYGADRHTAGARARFAEVFGRDVDVLPVSTGSAANALSLAALTPPWGSVLCHRDSHVNTDECGAPEFFTGGAKLVPCPATTPRSTWSSCVSRPTAGPGTCTARSRRWSASPR